MGQNNKSRIH